MINLFKKKSNLSFLENTKKSFWSKIKEFVIPTKKVISDELISDLEELLISLDLGIETSDKFLSEVVKNLRSLKEVSNEKLSEILEKVAVAVIPDNEKSNFLSSPEVIFLVGINGSGKTTSIAKLAYKFKSEGKRCLLIAADTFRAAAVQQLEEWSKRIEVEIFFKKDDEKVLHPSSVVYEGLDFGIKNNFDVILVDTSGRLHTKKNLMGELDKIYRVATNKLGRRPDDLLLVVDGTSGQNALAQTEAFMKGSDNSNFPNEAKITGLIITKMDGTSKGGIVISLGANYNIPVKYLGIGEKIGDIIPFDKKSFVKTLFSLSV